MKALIVDGEELLRLSLKEVILVSSNFQEIVEAASEHEFLAKTANHDDIALIIAHPGSLGGEGRDCMKLVRRLYPDAAVVTIMDRDGQRTTDCAGAVAVERGASVAEMVTAIRRALKLPLDGFGAVASRPAAPNVRAALEGGMDRPQASHAGRPTVADSVDLGRLSYRQKQILAMAADGLPNKEIAARLDIAEGTVKAHMHAIFKVLGVSNRTQAVIRYGAVGRAPAQPTGASQNSPSWAYAAAS
ncbi:response regulator transcription factor [Kordiimonas lacus]|uniref:DNA-binding response regulator, NarL/FixJ family, contains REC and HTH domains n=1 Tax=Kordiimonas lacus TaxID=637679 RepID=A0A1G7F3X5_9PROT|nr:response regulator transcription factor [Kordiimonas lacus]SDE70245.1 DNA-binding response regulator, NarL/FixJ family, contains REC and HTH domains [Kordiimonas lacus]